MKKKLLLFCLMALAVGTMSLPQKAFAADVATDDTAVTVTIPYVYNVIMPATLAIDLSTNYGQVAEWNQADDPTKGIFVLGNGADANARVQTNNPAKDITLSFTDGTGTVTEATSFTITVAKAGTASLDFVLEKSGAAGATGAPEMNGTTATAFADMVTNTYTCTGYNTDANGDAFLDLQFNLDESTLKLHDDKPGTMTFNTVLTITTP